MAKKYVNFLLAVVFCIAFWVGFLAGQIAVHKQQQLPKEKAHQVSMPLSDDFKAGEASMLKVMLMSGRCK